MVNAEMYRMIFAKKYREDVLFEHFAKMDTIFHNEAEDKATYATLVPLLLPDLISRAETFLEEEGTYLKSVGHRLFKYLVEPLDILSTEGLYFLDDAILFAMVLLRLEETQHIALNPATRSKCLFVQGIFTDLNPFLQKQLRNSTEKVLEFD